MKILVFPKDENPYQELLYARMRRRGVRVSYIGRLTPSHSLNVLLLPIEMAIRRLFGARAVHLHWVFAFRLPRAKQSKIMLLISQAWFILWLQSCRFLGLRLIWTVHNVLPHDQVFEDDVAMRRALVSTCDLVIVHSRASLSGLEEIGAAPKHAVVIPHGPFIPECDLNSLRQAGGDGSPYRFLFVGQLKAYKGVHDLLDAFEALPKEEKCHLTVAGKCQDPALLARLSNFPERDDISIAVGPEWLPDAVVSNLLSASDIVVLPFKKITTSGSAILAMSYGRPIIIPDAETVRDIPERAAMRYDGTVQGLTTAMATMATMEPTELAAKAEAARVYANRISWDEIAELTRLAILDTLIAQKET